MNRRFIFPAVCALILHAALVLGSRPADKPAVMGDPSAEPASLQPLPAILPVAVAFVATDDDVYPDEPKRGDTDKSNPALPDRLMLSAARPDFTILKESAVPVKSRTTVRIEAGILGRPEGNPEGLRLSDGVFDATKLDRVPRALTQVSARYPVEARMRGLEGEVVVEFTVDTTGRVVSYHVLDSTSREFEAAALVAVKHWRFEPGRRNGRIVRFSMVVPVRFRLNG